MTKPGFEAQAEQILASLQRHPRIVYQEIAGDNDDVERLRRTMPPLVPFGDRSYHGILPMIDWDHRLPTKTAILRIYAYYTESTLRAGVTELQSRTQQIATKDKYPEFDVPDFAGITADEAYEGEVARNGVITKTRLVSAWRRDIDHKLGRMAVQITRQSEHFRKLAAETRGQRPDYLGDLESVSWTPPCESNLAMWTVDVWYLMYLDASVGKGRSFLVDLEQQQVVGVREFVVRAG